MDALPGNTSDSDSNMDTRRANSPEHLAENRETDNSSPPVDPPEEIKENQQSTIPAITPETTCCENIKPFRCCINTDRLNLLRRKVEEAIKEKKTFTIKGGFQFIRNALLQRGWIEKIEIKTHVNKSCPANPPSIDEVCCNLPPKQDWESAAAHLAKCEKMILSRLLQTHDVDFYWNMRKDSNEWQQRLNKNKIINRFSRSLFTSKEGLCLLLQQLYWHTEPGVAYVRFPRCYTINFGDQCSAFVDDFRLTACISLLKWFTETIKENGEHSMCTADGKVPVTAIQFAIDRCTEFIAIQKHLDLDKEFHKVWDHEWDQFLTNFQLIVHDGEKFDDNNCYSLFAFENSAKNTLKNIAPYWPQLELDGIRNIWIMKPGNKCRGRDIILVKDANDVVRVMNHKLKYVVQKYIERPLLIYKAKFDIRQWFIVTCVQPLTIWMYRDCYLRFSSRIFSLDDFHESVHLTNHAVQHKYTNQERDKSLPDDNMWDNHTFKAYLRQIGQAEKWYKVIYPGMRECIIGAMLASQDTMDRRPNTFELYGADFMIAENFSPWLIEINSCPAMGPTTSVTARMCPQCFEDMVKVIIDRRRDPKADTGLFEMIYKQVLPQTPPYLGMTLSIRGRKLFKKKTSGKQKLEKKDSVVENKLRTKTIKPQMQMELIKNYNGPVIGNLIEELQETLFKNSVEEETDDPSSPMMEGISRSAPIQKPIVAVQDLQPVTQKATVSLSCKQRSNKNLFLDRKLNAVRESNTSSSTSSRKVHSYSYNHRPSKIHVNSKNPTSQQQNSSLYDKWKQGVENKQIKSVSNNRWEQDTASILKSNKSSDVLRNTVIHSEDIKFSSSLVNPCYISSLTRILPDIDTKNHTSQNLFTVGLGYKNNYFKPIIKENIILPMGASQVASVVENCCLKL